MHGNDWTNRLVNLTFVITNLSFYGLKKATKIHNFLEIRTRIKQRYRTIYKSLITQLSQLTKMTLILKNYLIPHILYVTTLSIRIIAKA